MHVVVCFSGISGKSQILFALVFTTRYLDLLTAFISFYNSIMKVNVNRLKLILPHVLSVAVTESLWNECGNGSKPIRVWGLGCASTPPAWKTSMIWAEDCYCRCHWNIILSDGFGSVSPFRQIWAVLLWLLLNISQWSDSWNPLWSSKHTQHNKHNIFHIYTCVCV